MNELKVQNMFDSTLLCSIIKLNTNTYMQQTLILKVRALKVNPNSVCYYKKYGADKMA